MPLVQTPNFTPMAATSCGRAGDAFGMDEIKTCCDCDEAKPVTEFHNAYKRADGTVLKFRYCKLCAKARQKIWRDNNLDYARKRGREKSQARRDMGLDKEYSKFQKLRAKYGLSREDWEALIEHQQGVCATCSRAFDASRREPFVDHDHATGDVRSLLCQTCNTAVGMLRDDPEIALQIAIYLQGPYPAEAILGRNAGEVI